MMQNIVIRNPRVIPFDVDKTLVIPKQDAPENELVIPILDPFSKAITYRVIHKPHLKLLKNYIARGAYVIVWSKNGHEWAEAVLDALKIKGVTIMDKPFAYVDDVPCTFWMGEHIYIKPTDSFGQEEQ
jgi:hypothetical protein